MKIESISVTKRKNLGGYEHLEISASAKVEENEKPNSAMIALVAYVEESLNGKPVNEYNTEIPPVIEEVKEVEVSTDSPSVSEKKTRAKKVKEEKVVVETPVASFIKYNRDIDAHKQILSGYLNSTHPTWKSVPTIKEFSASLVGADFLDEDGVIIDSFKKTLNDFFSKN